MLFLSTAVLIRRRYILESTLIAEIRSNCGNKLIDYLVRIPFPPASLSTKEASSWFLRIVLQRNSVRLFTEGIEYGSLHTLRIEKCSTRTSIPSLQGFSSLGTIEISECSELLSLPNGLNCCTSLGKIKIRSCNKLMFISIDSLPSLQQFDIRTCSSLESIDALHGLPSLHEFTIRDCGKLTSQLGSFPYLDRLEIRNCPSLETIPCSDNLTTLSSLKIYSCDGFISKFSELASLTSLRRLEIGEFCKELDSFPVIPQLEALMLSGWPKLKSLREQIQHFTSLTSLVISSFDEVEALPEWLGSLSSLTVLTIERCHNLKYLPLRQAMQRLTKLSSLNILCDCPLIKRCRKGGPEWPKISHIPDLFPSSKLFKKMLFLSMLC